MSARCLVCEDQPGCDGLCEACGQARAVFLREVHLCAICEAELAVEPTCDVCDLPQDHPWPFGEVRPWDGERGCHVDCVIPDGFTPVLLWIDSTSEHLRVLATVANDGETA